MDATDHGKVILAVVLGQGGTRALDYALRYVTADHFEDSVQAALFQLACRYADQTRGRLPRKALEDLLRNKPPGTAQLYLEYFDLVAGLRPSVSDFRHSIQQLRELTADRETAEALAQGMEILRNGARDEQGLELRGHADARHHVVAAFADIEHEHAISESPEGDIRKDREEVHKAYAKARELRLNGNSAAVATGLPRLDAALSGGFANGEFALVAGFSSAGKSQFCAHQAWHTSVIQRKNVVLFASETSRSNMRIRILGRHSRLPQFSLPRGLNTRDLRAGTLNPEDHAAFKNVLADFEGGDYGHCYIVQLPRGATMGFLESRLTAISRQFEPHLVIVDYLALLRPERARRDRREELAPLLMDAKQLAVTFGDGRGVPFVSPWQVNREGRKEVYKRGRYVLSDMAETAEAANTPDIILTMLEPEQDESRGRKVVVKFDVLKNRENERFINMEVTADFATSYFAVREEGADESLFDDPRLAAEEDEDELPPP